MKLYKKLVERIYDLGFVTFMTKIEKVDQETFYLHVLRF